MTTLEIVIAALAPLLALAVGWGAIALAGLIARWMDRLDGDGRRGSLRGFKTWSDDDED